MVDSDICVNCLVNKSATPSKVHPRNKYSVCDFLSRVLFYQAAVLRTFAILIHKFEFITIQLRMFAY